MSDSGASPDKDKEARNWAMACHLCGLAAFLGIPFGNVFGPLTIWLIKKDEIPLVESEGKKALNFQISFSIYGLVAFLSCFILIGLVVLPVLAIVWLIYTIIGAVKTSNAEPFEYPLTIKFFK